jgi:two-component system sensor histidine kinase BaeS
LLDANGAFLAGSKSASRLAVSIPVPSGTGAAVGTLELDPVENFDQRAMAFVGKQTQALWLGLGGALALSLLAAWVGSRHLTGPLRSLEAAAERIESGEFAARSGVERGDELGALGRAFDAMAERIERAEQERKQWISDSSHELRTPLAVLRAEVEALQDGVRKPDEKSLARLHKNIMQMGKLVDDLRLSLDRADGASSMAFETCCPAALAKEAGLDFKARFFEAGLVLDILGLDKLSVVKVSGDPDRLSQVFVNVFENSARYTARGGRLVASAQVKAGLLRIQFDDTSPAPPDAAFPKLFDRFYRADPSRSRELGGSGLGLAICKSIVEAHGGTVSASKSELGGLCLKITLPLET